LLQFETSGVTLFVRLARVINDRLQRRTLGAYFAARRARFFSRSISASLATVTSVLNGIEAGEQCLRFIVSLRVVRDADVQPTKRVDLVVIDLGKMICSFTPML